MAYTPTDWSDGVTLVDEAHLDHLEGGVVTADANASAALAALPAKEDKSAKGAVSGYAPLGADQKVPAANLPAVALNDLSFDGDWVAGTYQEGDTVVKDGVLFQCVGGPTSAVPDISLWGSLAPPPAVPAAVVATTLPVAPVDTQEAILVDSLTAPTYIWRFRYMASITDANKWVCIGGGPSYSAVETAEAVAVSAGYIALATAGPTFVVPRAGLYVVEIGALMANNNAGGGDACFMSYDIGATPGVDGDSIRVDNAGTTDVVKASVHRAKQQTLTAVTLTAKYRASGAIGNAASRWMSVRPVRVA